MLRNMLRLTLGFVLVLASPRCCRADILVTVAYGTTGLSNLTDAEALLASPLARVVTTTAPYLDYSDPDFNMSESRGLFGNNHPFPGESEGVNDQNFALRAVGRLVVDAPGTYTFGFHTDDGARLRIDGGSGFTTVIERNYTGAATQNLNQFTFASAGLYPFETLYFENVGHATFELFAGPGTLSFDAPEFRLVGDALGGGFSVAAVPEPRLFPLLAILSGWGGIVAAIRLLRDRRKSTVQPTPSLEH